MLAQRRKTTGRPNVLGDGAGYLTIKLTARQLRQINRIAGPAPGGRPRVIRDLIDVGLAKAAARKR